MIFVVLPDIIIHIFFLHFCCCFVYKEKEKRERERWDRGVVPKQSGSLGCHKHTIFKKYFGQKYKFTVTLFDSSLMDNVPSYGALCLANSVSESSASSILSEKHQK